METRDKTVIAIGDIHGELDRLREILKHTGLLGSRDEWAGGKSILVQTGDVIDRGPRPWESFLLLEILQSEARKKGGDVMRLLGNHELMLFQETWRYRNYPEPDQLAGIIKRAILEGDIQAAAYLCGWVFVHGALRLAMVERFQEAASKRQEPFQEALVKEMNATLKSAVAAGDFSHDIFTNKGIFWARYEENLRDQSSHQIRQVFGHTPGDGIRASDTRGRICIDIGLCFGGNPAYLKFSGGKAIAVEKGPGGWKERVIAED